MSDNNNFKPDLEGYKPLRPFNLFMKNNFPFIENTFEALDTYGLICQLVKYLNTVIENTNTMETNIGLLSNAFNELNDYISHYFDNLDVQEEINNKLDDMVESGELQEIITAYLNTRAIFCYDNVAAMKEATNLQDGSYAKTLGFYEKNDGGESLYYIKTYEHETIDNALVIELDNDLIAMLVSYNSIYIEQLGSISDGITDDSDIMQKAVNNFNTVYLTKSYLLKDIELVDNCKILGNGTAQVYTEHNHNIFNVYDSDNNVISGINFNGSELFEEGHNLIDIRKTDNLLIENCNFNKSQSDAITVSGGGQYDTFENKNITISNCNFIGDGNGRNAISVIRGENIVIEKCYFNNWTKLYMPGAIDIEPNPYENFYSNNILIKECLFENCYGTNGIISIYRPVNAGKVDNITVENCKFKDMVSIYAIFCESDDSQYGYINLNVNDCYINGYNQTQNRQKLATRNSVININDSIFESTGRCYSRENSYYTFQGCRFLNDSCLAQAISTNVNITLKDSYYQLKDTSYSSVLIGRETAGGLGKIIVTNNIFEHTFSHVVPMNYIENLTHYNESQNVYLNNPSGTPTSKILTMMSPNFDFAQDYRTANIPYKNNNITIGLAHIKYNDVNYNGCLRLSYSYSETGGVTLLLHWRGIFVEFLDGTTRTLTKIA